MVVVRGEDETSEDKALKLSVLSSRDSRSHGSRVRSAANVSDSF